MGKYKLYCGKIQNIEANTEQQVFFNNKKHYLLIFASKKPKGVFAEVPEKHFSELSLEEKKWLMAAKIWANSKYISDNSEALSESLEKFTSDLAAELEAESEKTKTTT